MAVGDYYQLDFTGTVNLTKIVLNNSQSSGNDFPSGIALYGSMDGTSFDSSAFATGSGAAGLSTISFTQRTLRAVRIKITSTGSTNWWSIGDIQTSCATQ